jgi:hypothetical protein
MRMLGYSEALSAGRVLRVALMTRGKQVAFFPRQFWMLNHAFDVVNVCSWCWVACSLHA